MFNQNVKKKMKFVYYFQQKKIKMELLINFQKIHNKNNYYYYKEMQEQGKVWPLK